MRSTVEGRWFTYVSCHFVIDTLYNRRLRAGKIMVIHLNVKRVWECIGKGGFPSCSFCVVQSTPLKGWFRAQLIYTNTTTTQSTIPIRPPTQTLTIPQQPYNSIAIRVHPVTIAPKKKSFFRNSPKLYSQWTHITHINTHQRDVCKYFGSDVIRVHTVKCSLRKLSSIECHMQPTTLWGVIDFPVKSS